MLAHLRRVYIVLALIAGAAANDGVAARAHAQAKPAGLDPQAAVEDAARRFRIQVYNTFRNDPAELKRRRDAADEAQARWRAAGGRPQDAQALLDWLNAAGYVSRPELRQSLPALPSFGSAAIGAKPRAMLQRDARPRSQNDESSTVLRNSTSPPVRHQLESTPNISHRGSLPRRNAHQPAQTPAGATSPAVPQAADDRRGPIQPAAPPPARTLLLPAPWDIVSRAPSAQSSVPSGPQPRRTAAGMPVKPPEVIQPRRAPAAGEITAGAARDVAAVAPVHSPQAVDARRETIRQSIRPSMASTPPTAAGDVGLKTSAPSAANPRPRGADSLARPSVGSATAPRIALAKPRIDYSAEDIRAILDQAKPAAEVVVPENNLNVGELLARASGYRFGLRTIDSMLHEQTPLNAAELARLLGELEALLDQRHDLLLYEQLVSADVRERLVRSLGFPQSTVAEFGSRIAAVRQQVGQQPGSDDRKNLEALAELSKRLSRLGQD